MQGFLGQGKFFKPWQRRLVTRLVAIVPAAVISGTAGVSGTARLLNLSQVRTLLVESSSTPLSRCAPTFCVFREPRIGPKRRAEKQRRGVRRRS